MAYRQAVLLPLNRLVTLPTPFGVLVVAFKATPRFSCTENQGFGTLKIRGLSPAQQCPQVGAKQTSRRCPRMSGYSHKRKLALPQEVEHGSLTTLREKLAKIGAKLVRHGRYVTFQLAEVAVAEGTVPA